MDNVMIYLAAYSRLFGIAAIYGIGFNGAVSIFGYIVYSAIKIFKEAKK